MTVPFTIIHDKDVCFVVVCPNLTFRYDTLKASRKRGQRTDEKLGKYTVSVSVTVPNGHVGDPKLTRGPPAGHN